MPWRVLIVTPHAGREDEQAVFEALAVGHDVRLKVLGPRRAYCAVEQTVHETRRATRPGYATRAGLIYGARLSCGGPYLTGFLSEVLLFRPDVIHVFNEPYTAVNMQGLLYASVLARRARCYSFAGNNAKIRLRGGRWGEVRQTFVQQHSAGAACRTTGAKAALAATGFPERKLDLTHYGTALKGFRAGSNVEERRALGLEKCFVIGYVGKVDIDRGLWTLLLSLKRLPASFKCLCVGGGPWQRQFAKTAAGMGLGARLVCVGEVPHVDVARYMQAMDVLVMPSETGLGGAPQSSRALPEAMASGLPVVASDAGALPEIVGEAGLVFPERDFPVLASSLLRLAAEDHLRARFRRAGVDRAQRVFSSEAFAERLRNLYRLPAGVHRVASDTPVVIPALLGGR